ncbi:MAG: MurR/RpiR family transcriptional regulator [Erysipelotrichales bacterium]|nr:MurR/RpiR family transcriptional regulator [Erysipelotrichales bacterium]
MPIKISDEDYLNLSESEKHVIDYLNDHEKELSDLSITMIAARTYTSLATVSRAIRKCGYNGISELRYSLQQRQPLYSPDSLSVNDILTQSLRECTRTIDNISIPSILKITEYIKSANRIFIYARGYTALVAEEFQHYLMLLGYNAFVMKDSIIMKRTEYLVKSDDLVFIISVRNTTPELAESAEMAKKIGAKVVSCCCVEGTNLEKFSDVTVIGYSENIVENDTASCYSRVSLTIICHIITEYLGKY